MKIRYIMPLIGCGVIFFGALPFTKWVEMPTDETAILITRILQGFVTALGIVLATLPLWNRIGVWIERHW